MAAKTVKSCDLPLSIATKVFAAELNPGKVEVKKSVYGDLSIVTDVEPKDLTYPEGWYYAKGDFRNKHQSTTGLYEECPMTTSKGKSWSKKATYCTLDD